MAGRPCSSWSSNDFDLVLLDIRMPDIDGIEVARRVRLRELERSETAVPIIAITADADAATREACLAAGINAVLAKPVIPEQLARAMAAHCEGIGRGNTCQRTAVERSDLQRPGHTTLNVPVSIGRCCGRILTMNCAACRPPLSVMTATNLAGPPTP